MSHLNIYGLTLLLLIIGQHRIKIAAEFGITKEALKTSHQLVAKVTSKRAYASKKELNSEFKKLFRTILAFAEFAAAYRNDGYVDLTSGEQHRSAQITTPFAEYSGLLARLDEYSLPGIARKPIRRKFDLENRVHYDAVREAGAAEELACGSFWRGYGSLLRVVDTIHAMPFVVQPMVNLSMFDVMMDDQHCLHQSHGHQIFEFLRRMALHDAEAFVAVQYTYAQMKVMLDGSHFLTESDQDKLSRAMSKWEEKNPIKKMKTAELKFVKRNSKTLSTVKSRIDKVSRNVSVCDNYRDYFRNRHGDREDKEDITYTKLNKLFQKYIANEVDLNEAGTCTDDCPFHRDTRVYGCFDDEAICARQAACNGRIWDCGNDVTSTIYICPSTSENSRYNFVRINKNNYGRNTCQTTLKVESWIRGFSRCSYCLCTCENSEVDSDAYFSLQSVVSDVESNEVITGVRFQKVNHVVHIQIQQGRLLPEGRVASPAWKPLNNYTVSDARVVAGVDYHKISWENGRTLYVDRLDSPKNHVMTGIRFNLADGNLRLEIRAAPFDFESGILSGSGDRWIFNPAKLDDRVELKPNDLESFIRVGYHERIPKRFKVFGSSRFVKFTTSCIKLDVGQNTVPYVDLEPVETLPAVPTSGAGLFLRDNDMVGPILAMELLTYDFSTNI